MDKKWAKFLGFSVVSVVCSIMVVFGLAFGQVTSGTVNSKMLDGVGNKITSTVVGATRGLDVSIIAGGSSGPTYLDADAIANQTASAVHGQTYMYNGATWDRVRGTIVGGVLVNISNASLAVTGTFFQATQPVSGTFWQATQPVSGTVAVSNALLLDVTYTGRMPIGVSPADNESNTNTALSRIGNFNFVFDGVAWDRWTGAVSQSGIWNITNITGTVSLPTGAATEATLATRLADATFTGRFSAAYVDADAVANQTTTAMHGQGYGYNGATWDRSRTASGANNTAVTSTGIIPVSVLSTWSCTHAPAAATQATCSKAAGGGTVRHVVTHITVCLLDNTTGPVSIVFGLRNGATGVGTIMWTVYVGIPRVQGATLALEDSKCVVTPIPSLTGSANTAMTLESTSTPPVDSFATVTLMGYSVP